MKWARETIYADQYKAQIHFNCIQQFIIFVCVFKTVQASSYIQHSQQWKKFQIGFDL